MATLPTYCMYTNERLGCIWFASVNDLKLKWPFNGVRPPWWMSGVSSQVDLPEEREQLLSAAGGPGQIHTVVATIGGHYKARLAAGVSHSVMVDSKTGGKEIRCRTNLTLFMSHLNNLTKHNSNKLHRVEVCHRRLALPVPNLMSDGNPQVETCVLGDHTAPLATASSTQLCYTSDLFIPVGQHQVVPLDAG